jgi:hypothetical protein
MQMKWPMTLIRKLSNNPEMVKIYLIPGLLFFLDFVLRAVLGADLIDAGADMAMLGVATFVTILVENDDHQPTYTFIPVIFMFIFLVVWIICLKIVSIQNSTLPILLNVIDFRLILSWLIGLVAFILSGIITNGIINQTVSEAKNK